ncbi:hypothetical protein [Haemophilus haemolyticus]|uniref:hypothetical protein n=1 Tax=Haemophilus haemolyticus TaxID=726 RepID=UPI001EFC8230|nr:hypothetical protein [Haemophilus haemolyticus]
MSKNISVKINNGNKTLESVKLNSANQKVIIKAQPHVNYELVDETTQYAPEMIDTKRVGNDLHIAFEGTDINKESDLVLEGYYEHDNTELVLGMAEDGQYYAYVPQSGMESDAVTLLADQVFAPQALGGNSVTAPFWAFNPSWLWVAAGVAAVGGIIAAASGSHGGGSSNNANNNSNTAKDTTAPAKPTVEAKDNGSVEVTPPADADTKSVEVSYTDEAGIPKTATLTKGEDGNWTSNNPDVAVDPVTGKATIPADKVKDGSQVTAKATDTSGNTGEEGTANAGNNPDTTAPAQPTVEAKDNGSVDVTPPTDADTQSVEVNYTDEAGTPKTATLTKGNDGNWTSNNPDVAVDPVSGKATIPADKVKDGSPVTAKATDNAGNTGEEGTANAGNNPDTTAPAKPTIEAKKNGFVYITPPADAKLVEVHYIDEKGNPQTVTITKDADKGWVSSNPENIWLNSETGKITLLAHKVKGGSLVKASATDNQGNTGEASTENAVNIIDTYGPTEPDLFHLEDGSLLATMPIEADVGDSVVIKLGIYKDRNAWDWDPHKGDIDSAETLATLTKQQDGSWISDKPENVPNVDAGNTNTIIPANKLKGFQILHIYAVDPAGNQSRVELTYINNNLYDKIGYATITVKTDGFVEISPPATQDLKLMKVSYTDKAGTRKITSLTKGEDGNWTSDNPDMMVEPASGKAMISADKIQDGSKVYVNLFDNSGMNTYSHQTVNKTPDTTAPSAPEIIPSTTDGSVTVKVPDDAEVGDTVILGVVPETSSVFLNPEDSAISSYLTLTKNADGSWTSNNPTMLPNIAAGQNSTTIPQEEVKDGSKVTAMAIDLAGNRSADVMAQAGEDTKVPDEAGVSSNTIDSNGMGSSGDDYASFKQIGGFINMGAGNDILEARSTEMPFFFQIFEAIVDMGSGDDIVRTSGPIQDDNPFYKDIFIDGGDDFDTLEFVNRDGKEIITTISLISNFEKIDIKGTLNNTINIQKYDVERNHNDKPTVDDSGQSHNNVLIVDGDEGDKVNLNDISEVASSQVNYKGKTYHVYHTDSNELWINSDIAVA